MYSYLIFCMYIYKYVRACVLQKYAWLARFENLMLIIFFCESYADKIIVNLMLIKRTIHGEAVVYVWTSRELCFLLD